MKRLHVSLNVENLEQSIRFYAALFNAEPTVRKDDYAKWMLEDPRVNFAIATRGCGDDFGIDHVGIQTETPEELAEITRRLKTAGEASLQQKDANCCYAVSDKTWVADPSGLQWETFFTHGAITTYGADSAPVEIPSQTETSEKAACCS